MSIAYNVILGRSLINNMRVVIHLGYLLMKFPAPSSIGQVWGDQKKAQVFYISSTKETNGKEVSHTLEETMSISEQTLLKPQLVEAPELVRLYEDEQDKILYVGSLLPLEQR